MKIRVTAKLHNDKMVAAREALGLNQTKAAKAAGVSLEAWIHLEKLRYSRYSPEAIEKHATCISLYLGIPAEEIAPRELWGSEIPSTFTCIRSVDTKRLLEAISNHEHHYLLPEPLDNLEQEETREVARKAIGTALKTLTFREREVLKLRFGLSGNAIHTLAECGQRFKATKERIRQIEAKALRKLNNPHRLELLKGVI